MDIKEKQAIWLKEKPLFEAEFIHSHLLPFFHFNENTGDYEIKTESVNNTDEEDRKVAYESLNTGWVMWLRAKRTAKAQAVLEGFVIVSQKDLLELTIAINAVDLATHTESKTNEVREMWQQVALKLMALGISQEQGQ